MRTGPMSDPLPFSEPAPSPNLACPLPAWTADASCVNREYSSGRVSTKRIALFALHVMPTVCRFSDPCTVKYRSRPLPSWNTLACVAGFVHPRRDLPIWTMGSGPVSGSKALSSATVLRLAPARMRVEASCAHWPASARVSRAASACVGCTVCVLKCTPAWSMAQA